MFSGVDEVKDFRNRGVVTRKMPDLVQTLGKHARAVKQLLIKRSYRRKALTGELAAFHADDVEARQCRIRAARKRKRDHVAAHPGKRTDHHLRPHPAELMHRRQAADENMIADLDMAAERGRGRKDDVVADDAVVADMAAIHEITAIADA